VHYYARPNATDDPLVREAFRTAVYVSTGIARENVHVASPKETSLCAVNVTTEFTPRGANTRHASMNWREKADFSEYGTATAKLASSVRGGFSTLIDAGYLTQAEVEGGDDSDDFNNNKSDENIRRSEVFGVDDYATLRSSVLDSFSEDTASLYPLYPMYTKKELKQLMSPNPKNPPGGLRAAEPKKQEASNGNNMKRRPTKAPVPPPVPPPEPDWGGLSEIRTFFSITSIVEGNFSILVYKKYFTEM
jgi:hypothetical protein